MGNNPTGYTDPTGHCRIDDDPDDCLMPDRSNVRNSTPPNPPGGGGGGDPEDMETSDQGEEFIMYWEQNPPPLYPYPDMGGNCTIGWGHVLQRDGCGGWPNKTYRNGITIQTAQMFFDHDIAVFENLIRNTITVDLTQAQFDALVSYTFNTGDQTNNPYFVKNIPELVNSGDFEAVAEAIRSGPITSGGLESPKLVERRQREADLFLFGTYFP